LRGNLLNGSILDIFANLIEFMSLDVSHNQLIISITLNLMKLPNLEVIKLSSSKTTSQAMF
jgi:hypothetical protein